MLDRAAAQVSIRIRLEPFLVFPALAGVRFPADAVHRDGQCLVGFLADGAKRHGSGGEALDDFFCGFDFFQRHRLVALLQLHQTAKRA